jgi:hypothetical protein
MAGEMVTAVTTLGGVVLGGALSLLVQNNGQRLERRKQELALAQARRAERLAVLERFITVAAEAERQAFQRPTTWSDVDPWPIATQEVMNRLWVAERMLRVLFADGVHTPARTYFEVLNRSVWDGDPDLPDMYRRLDQVRERFLDEARAEI